MAIKVDWRQAVPLQWAAPTWFAIITLLLGVDYFHVDQRVMLWNRLNDVSAEVTLVRERLASIEAHSEMSVELNRQILAVLIQNKLKGKSDAE